MTRAVEEHPEMYGVALDEFLNVFDDPALVDPWRCGGVTSLDIERELKANRLEPFPCDMTELPDDKAEAHRFHARRIAYLVQHPQPDPVLIEVASPAIGHYQTEIVDGWHRYSAALFRGDETIPVSFGGGVEEFFELFPSATELRIGVLTS